MSYPSSLDLHFGSEKFTADPIGRLSFGKGGSTPDPTPTPTGSYWRTSSFNIKNALEPYVGNLGTYKSSVFSTTHDGDLINHLYYVKIGSYDDVELDPVRLEQYKAWLSQAQISLVHISEPDNFGYYDYDKIVINGDSSHSEWNVDKQVDSLGFFSVDVNQPEPSDNGEFYLVFIVADENGVVDPMGGESGSMEFTGSISLSLTPYSNVDEFSCYYTVDILSGDNMDAYLQGASISNFGVGGENEISSTYSSAIGSLDFPDGVDTNGMLSSISLINSFDVDLYEDSESEIVVAQLRFTLVVEDGLTPNPPYFYIYEEDTLSFEKVES